MTPNGRSFKLGTSGLAEATYTEYKAEHPINADQRPEQQLYHQTLVDEDDRSYVGLPLRVLVFDTQANMLLAP